MKFIFSVYTILMIFCNFSFAGEVQQTSKSVVLGVFDSGSKKNYDDKLQSVLQEELAACKRCEVVNFTPYDEKGEYNPADLLGQIAAFSGASVLLVNWNEKLSSKNKEILEAFTKISNQGVLIVAAAGQPKSSETSAPLNLTLFGQIPKAFIIGELGERDRLWGSSFYGPEMLTALRPPKDKMGQGLAPAIFASRLTRDFSKRTDWGGFFLSKKTTTRKMWLELYDCFGR